MFKKGDQVKCVNTGIIKGSSVAGELVKGGVYIVEEDQVDKYNVRVNVGHGFFPQRFVKVAEEPKKQQHKQPQKEQAMEYKVGQQVRIIDTEGHHFAMGQIVTVAALPDPGGTWYTLVGETQSGGPDVHQMVIIPEFEALAPTLDLTKPVFTTEGTPVQIVTTTGRDPKYPVLGYEGKARLLSKFTLAGKNKNGTARRHLTNTQVVEPEVVIEKFVALLDPSGNLNSQQVASKLYDSAKDAEKDVSRRAHSRNSEGPVGIAKVTLVSGRFPK